MTADDKKEYLIDLFYSEIDPVSGNCHSQIGRVCFVKDVIYNPGSNLSSPNVLLDENGKQTKIKLASKRQVVNLGFGQYKWENPLKYIDKGELSEEDCQNKCWISVGDVLERMEVPRIIAKAMKDFISKSNHL